MGINNRLYDRGHEGYDKSIGSKLLYVDGVLPTNTIGLPYEGRLQIHNNIGACSVEILSSENLPDGAGVYVDNTTSQVVVTWPAKNIQPIQLINPGFETGDLTGWTYESKGGSGTLAVSQDYKDVGVYSAYWAGGKGLGSEGGIECLAVNDAKGLVNPGDMVTAKLRVMYNPGGGTPKGSRGQVRLQWYDSSDNLLKVSEGFLIKTRAYNGKWTDTVVSDRAVPNSAYVRFAGWVTATGAGHTYFDSAEWDLPPYVGADVLQTITLQLRVYDAAGRSADWGGNIYATTAALVGEWKCNDTDNICRDSSGYGNHGTYRTGVVKNITPIKSGSSRCISITAKQTGGAVIPIPPPYTDFSWLTGDFTLECCCVNDDTSNSGWGYPIVRMDSYNFGTVVWAIDEDSAGTTIGFGIGSNHYASIPGPWRGVPVHIVAERSGSNYNVYVNGILRSTEVQPGIMNQVSQSQFLIGGVSDEGSGYGFVGRISDVRLYNGALGADGVLARATLLGFA